MTFHPSLWVLPFSVLISAAWAAEPIVLQTAQFKALGIEVQKAASSSQARGGSLPARVVVPTGQMRVVTAPVGGLVDRLGVVPGSAVQRGQVVAYLASPQALELQRDVLQSSSQAALQQQNLKRDEQLFAEGLIAESRLQATRSAAAQAQAQASERRQGLTLAGIAPGSLGGAMALVAPIDGVVLEQGVQLGQRVDAATLIYRIARLSPLWLEIQAPFDLAAALQIGDSVKLANGAGSGKLLAIGRAVDAGSQTVLLRAEVSGSADKLYPGQVVEVEITAGKHAPQRLPASALVREQGRTLVFVQTASSDQGVSFAARPVRLLSQGGDSVTVEGVAADDLIAVKGLSGLKSILAGVGK